jgi:cytochrome c peroxidase
VHTSRSVTRGAAAVCSIVTLAGAGLLPTALQAQAPPAVASLKTAAIPRPANLGVFVKDEEAAIRLGKALFWDMQVGSDAVQACASCHFHAGADNRLRNQLNPGLIGGDTAFAAPGGPNSTLALSDFPFHRLADVDDPRSAVLWDTNDVVSSQGVFHTLLGDIVPGQAEETGTSIADPVFSVGGTKVRRVEPRNTPTVINAVFNFRNFWDGRAQAEFNGVNSLGRRDPNARVLRVVKGTPQPVPLVGELALDNSSLASQAMDPPTSPFESSFERRVFPKIGKKVLSLKPLAKQIVDPEDSVLGNLAEGSRTRPEPGLHTTYETMIKQAFRPEWWNANETITYDAAGVPRIGKKVKSPSTDEFTQMEANFSLFWGLAIQCYEATLVSDDSRVDRFLAGSTQALSAEERQGLQLFQTKGRCVFCHIGAELTAASVADVRAQHVRRIPMGDGGTAAADTGYLNIGVRPTTEDPGVGGTDRLGQPLAETRLAQMGLFADAALTPPLSPSERIAVAGAFKVPSLRNVELTAPYFHNGGQATLDQVIEFYNRGGDFGLSNRADLAPGIAPMGLSAAEKSALVAFLKALTDERVRWEKAPFDHPQLFVPNGHPIAGGALIADATGKARDALLEIPAVGKEGADGPLPPVFPQ